MEFELFESVSFPAQLLTCDVLGQTHRQGVLMLTALVLRIFELSNITMLWLTELGFLCLVHSRFETSCKGAS